MLSKGEKLIEKKRLLALPMLERPLTVRLKFRKTGALQYISHLDLQRTFNRVLVRACIPVWYTKGFNPHAKLVFSTPLSVGAQSVYEFLDIRIDRAMECREIMDRLNRELTEELCIVDAYIPTSDFSEIAWAAYDLELQCKGASEALAGKIQQRLSTAPLYLTKRTKSGEKEIDIIPLIQNIEVRYNTSTNTVKISAVLRATSVEFLNPEMLITALKQTMSLFDGNLTEEWYTIMRTAVMKEDGTLFS